MLHTMRIMAPTTTSASQQPQQHKNISSDYNSNSDFDSDSSYKRRHIHLSGGVFMVQQFLTILLIVVATLVSQINVVQGTNLGSKCQHDMDCTDFIKGSTCSANGYCECAPYFVQYDDSTCLSSQLLGGDCLLDDQCTMKVANSSCSDGACRCVEGFLQFRKHTCLGPALPGAVCYSHAHCRMNDERTHCDFLIPNLFGRCQCTAPTKLNGGLCVDQEATAIVSSSTTAATNVIDEVSSPIEEISHHETNENQQTDEIHENLNEVIDAKIDVQATQHSEDHVLVGNDESPNTEASIDQIHSEVTPAKTTVQQMLTPVDVTTEHIVPPLVDNQPTEAITEDYPYKMDEEYNEYQQPEQQQHQQQEDQESEPEEHPIADVANENVETTNESSQPDNVISNDTIHQNVAENVENEPSTNEQADEVAVVNEKEDEQDATEQPEQQHFEEHSEEHPEQQLTEHSDVPNEWVEVPPVPEQTQFEENGEHNKEQQQQQQSEQKPDQPNEWVQIPMPDNQQAESTDLAEDTMKFDYDAAQDEYEIENENDNENENEHPNTNTNTNAEEHNEVDQGDQVDQEQAESEHQISEVETKPDIIEEHGEPETFVAPTEANAIMAADDEIKEKETDHNPEQPEVVATTVTTEGNIDQKQQSDHKTELENESENETETKAETEPETEIETDAEKDTETETEPETEAETATATETQHNGDQLNQEEHVEDQHALDKKDEVEVEEEEREGETAPAATQQSSNESEKATAVVAEQHNNEEAVSANETETETITETTEDAVNNEFESEQADVNNAETHRDQEDIVHEPENVGVAIEQQKVNDEPVEHVPATIEQLPADQETEESVMHLNEEDIAAEAEHTSGVRLENTETEQTEGQLDNEILQQANNEAATVVNNTSDDPEDVLPVQESMPAEDVAESTQIPALEELSQTTSSLIKANEPEDVSPAALEAQDSLPASNGDQQETHAIDHAIENEIQGAESVDDNNKVVTATNAPLESEHVNEIAVDVSNEEEQTPEIVAVQKETNQDLEVPNEPNTAENVLTDNLNLNLDNGLTVAHETEPKSELSTDAPEKGQNSEAPLPEKDFKESESIADILSDLMIDENNEELTTLAPVEDSVPAESNDLPMPDLLTDNSSLSDEHFATGETPTTEQSETAEVLVETLNPNDAINQTIEPSTSTESSNTDPDTDGEEETLAEHTLSPEELPFDMTSLEDTRPQELESDNLVTEGSSVLASGTVEKIDQAATQTEAQKIKVEENEVEDVTANPSNYVEITTQTMLGLASRVTLMEPAAPVVTTLKPLMASPTATEEVAASEIATPEPAKLVTSTHNTPVEGAGVSNSKTTSEIRKRVDLGLEAVSLGLSCINDKQCQLADPHTICNSRGVCDCAAAPTTHLATTNTQHTCNAERTGCSKGTFQCRSSGVCISWFFVCDGRDDCNDASDEECTFNARLNQTCPQQAFLCEQSGRCISRAALCDGRKQCPHGEDEIGCAGVLKSTGGATSCPPHTFRCNSGECLPEYEYCNAIISCRDGSDEPPHLCGERPMPNFFQRLLKAGGLAGSGSANDPAGNCPHRCSNGRCRSTAIVCSGRDGCGDGTDEQTCSVCRCPAPSNHNLNAFLVRQRPMPLW